jgi:Mlc titration factor MtfA (ptsG expression regulator)
MNVILPAIILIGLALFIVYSIFKLLYDLIVGYWNFSRGKSAENNPSGLTNDHPVVISFLSKSPYYKALSPEGKEKFSKRLILFLADKKFIGMEGLVVTDEMRVLISAAATQVTFGLDKFMLLLFHTIRIYPGEFFSKLAEADLKGGATPGGMLLLSWRDFLRGNEIPDDKLNLGLHEMAHALLLDMLYGSVHNFQVEGEIGNWERAGEAVMEKLREKNPNFLRSYGGTNEQEFFAVCVENFFESPAELKSHLPDVYLRLCRLLNQDPLNTYGDYQFERAAYFS